MDEIITINETAKLIGVAPGTVYAWAKLGRLQQISISGFEKQSVLKFAELYKQFGPKRKKEGKRIKNNLES